MEHSHSHTHTHLHDPAETKRQINRISRMIGHLEHIKKMIAANEDCADVLIQLSAVKSAVSGLGKEIIKVHIDHCIAHAVEDGDTEMINEFMTSMQIYIDV